MGCWLIRMLCTVKSPVKAEALTVNAFAFTGLCHIIHIVLNGMMGFIKNKNHSSRCRLAPYAGRQRCRTCCSLNNCDCVYPLILLVLSLPA